MKNFISILERSENIKNLLKVVLIIIILTTVTGCLKEEPTKIKLTGDNFSEYIILNVSLEDFEEEKTQGLFTTYEYRGVAKLKATTSLKKDVKVEDITIKGKLITYGKGWSLKEYDFELALDKDGKAEINKTISTGNYGLTIPDAPTIGDYYNYELQEGEFFVDKILITSVNGYVYDVIEK